MNVFFLGGHCFRVLSVWQLVIQQKKISMLPDRLYHSAAGGFSSVSLTPSINRTWSTILVRSTPCSSGEGGQEPRSSLLYSHQPTPWSQGCYVTVLLALHEAKPVPLRPGRELDQFSPHRLQRTLPRPIDLRFWAGSGTIDGRHEGSVAPGVPADEPGFDTVGKDCGHSDWTRMALRGPCPSFGLCLSPAGSGDWETCVGKAQAAQEAETKEIATHTGGCEDKDYICEGDNG